jgi:hypothetical protein
LHPFWDLQGEMESTKTTHRQPHHMSRFHIEGVENVEGVLNGMLL